MDGRGKEGGSETAIIHFTQSTKSKHWIVKRFGPVLIGLLVSHSSILSHADWNVRENGVEPRNIFWGI